MFHCASEAAIFIPWAVVTAAPKRLPTDSWMSVIGTATISASFAACRNSSTLRPRRKCQHETPSIMTEPKIRPARIVCSHAVNPKPLVSSDPTSVSWALPSTTL